MPPMGTHTRMKRIFNLGQPGLLHIAHDSPNSRKISYHKFFSRR